MNIVFLMDPLEEVIFEKDTSLALMWGAQRKGHKVFYLPNHGLSLTPDGPVAHVTEIEASTEKGESLFKRKRPRSFYPDDIDVMFIRTDPPFDQRYLLNSWILDHMPESVVIINRPEGIRTVNEKLWAMKFSDIIPPAIVTQDKQEMLEFIEKYKKFIVKPTNGYGGRQIFVVSPGDVNQMVILETVSRSFTEKIIIQSYIDAAQTGDKRILLLNGEPLGAILRVHSSGDHRNNIFAGGQCFPASVTGNDWKIIQWLRPGLIELGLFFVGIDIIGDYLIEINVTSPTCLQEINRAGNGLALEDRVIEFAERLAMERRKQ
ncbi:MAG: glutathione synthase [Candidatus Omnitrophota bacterium]